MATLDTLQTAVDSLTSSTNILLTEVSVGKATLDQKVIDATTQADNAATSAINASNSAGAAQTAESNAQGYASLAQATNPDSPIRLNPREIIADFTVASAYNATSTGPITIAPGITVTVQDNAIWSIV